MATLYTGMDGAAGYGEQSFRTSAYTGNLDDGFTQINITSVFGAAGINFGGTSYTSVYLSTNGLLTFASGVTSYTPGALSSLGQPALAPYWTDIDITSAGEIYWDLDAASGKMTITYANVPAYSGGGTVNFQMQITSLGGGDFNVEYLYENIGFTNGGSGAAVVGTTNGITQTLAEGSGDPAVLATYASNDFDTNDPAGVYSMAVEGGVAFAGDGVVDGTTGNDNINGSYTTDPDGDRIDNSDATGYAGGTGQDDYVLAGAGNDTVTSGLGRDNVYGGAGADALFGGVGNDTLDGGTENDSIDGGSDNDLIYGGSGDDTLTGGVASTATTYTPAYTEITAATQTVTGTSGRPNFAVQTVSGDGNLTTGNSNPLMGAFNLGNGDSTETHTHTASSQIAGGRILFNAINGNETLTVTIDGAVIDLNTAISSGMVTFTGASTYAINGAGQIVRIGGGASSNTTGTLVINVPYTTLALNSTGTTGNGLFYEYYVNTTPLNVAAAAGGDDTIHGGDGNDVLSGDTGNDSLLGDAGQDTLAGGTGNDTMSGGLDNDVLSGDAGDDSLLGGDGADSLTGGFGNDTLSGDAGNDTLIANQGNDALYGGANADLVYAGSGVDTAYGGTGDDTIDGDLGRDLLYGDDGNDLIYGGSGSSAGTTYITNGTFTGGLSGWTGTDMEANPEGSYFLNGSTNGVTELDGGGGVSTTVIQQSFVVDNQLSAALTFQAAVRNSGVAGSDGFRADVLDASGAVIATLNVLPTPVGIWQNFNLPISFPGAGTYTLRLTELNPTVSPGEGAIVDNIQITANDLDLSGYADTLLGGAGDDTLYGYQGNDSLSGETGNDLIYGGENNDALYGGDDNDQLLGENGADILDGGAGLDTLYGGLGDDFLDGGLGNDTLYGDDGNDALNGGAGADWIYGGIGNDAFDGGDDNDTLYGGTGVDDVRGAFGDDALYGDAGNDILRGGAGNDLGYGGADDDTVLGQTGNDTVYGGLGNDSVDGGDEDDVVYGDDGDDRLFGGAGADALLGGLGNDTLDGGTGNDTLTFDAGTDSASGGDDRDSFVQEFGANAYGDVADGSEGGDDYDTLDLSAWGWSLTNVVYDPMNLENGTVEFLNTSGGVIGTMTFTNIEQVIPCFTPGVMIATDRGAVAVEELCVGDKVLTRDAGLQPIRWIGARKLGLADLIVRPHLRPVQIGQGALGHGLPLRDTLVSPQHRMLIEGAAPEMLFGEAEVLVAATHLTALPGVKQTLPAGVTYIHLLLDRHEIICANGAWTESFQPADRNLASMGPAQRAEIAELFPEMQVDGEAYQSARLTLKAHEARVLLQA